MLTRDDIHSDADLMRYVELAIGRAYQFVGQFVGAHRTDRAVVARILWEHGAQSSAVQIAVEQYITRQIGEPAYDVAEAQAAQEHLENLAERGFTSEALARSAPGAHRGGGWEELRETERAYSEATRGLAAHAGAVRAAVDAWWRGHTSTLEALCDKHAGLLLAARRTLPSATQHAQAVIIAS